jgi:hypothetical protein
MDNNWKMLLEQQRDGTILSGSREELADSVRRGADLRVYMTTKIYEETLYFQQTYAGETDEFAGFVSHHHSFEHRGTVSPQPYMCMFKYDGLGVHSAQKWHLGDEIIEESGREHADFYGVHRWFVCDRWRFVYEHDENGQPIAGSLDELKDEIRKGSTIGVGIRQLCGLAEDDQSGPPHISFLTAMLPFVWGDDVIMNCDPILVGPPKWPFLWNEGLHFGIVRPSTTGAIECFLAEPGKMPFERVTRRRGMQWLSATRG